MIRDCSGNLVQQQADALVNTVNTVGVMGKGIALQFKRAFPEMFKSYERACKAGEVQLGRMHVWESPELVGPRFIINFPTKDHWKAKSKIADIRAGLTDLVRVIQERGITSIAVPPLGCGNGGLNWADVRPLIESALGSLAIDVCLYSPGATPEAAAMPVATTKPSLTRMRAYLLSFMARYGDRGLGASLLELQKGMYFFEVLDGPKNLNFIKGVYGPYSSALDHMVNDLEGHYITGFGDGSQRVTDAAPLFVTTEARAETATWLAAGGTPTINLDRVLELVEGYETPYFMELLATLHYLSREHAAVRTDPQRAGELVRNWSPRKAGLFGQHHVQVCWDRLNAFNWLASSNDVCAPQ
jgi:O-acetyl-ADP-ribose deacetylase (regulator of RNase III)